MRGEFIDVLGQRIYYYAAGTRGGGDPILLIHGFPTTSHLWGNLVPLLPSGRRIIVPDLLGFGRSDFAESANLTIAGHASRLAALLGALGVTRCAVAGHHAGALIGACLAVADKSLVSHLALLHPVGGDAALTGTFAVMRAFMSVTRVVPERLLHRPVRRELARWFTDPARGRTSVDLYLHGMTGPGRWNAFLSQLRQFSPADVMHCTALLAGLTVPCAIVAGGRDPAVPRAAVDAVRRVLPNATLDIVNDARHFTPEESPELVARLMTRLLET